ncbi:hypothetical protein N184_32710 [Sinorhizobium sp. GL28]|nr:hypothetical protein N184_32710 [Sinorhizobium sp. GL28]
MFFLIVFVYLLFIFTYSFISKNFHHLTTIIFVLPIELHFFRKTTHLFLIIITPIFFVWSELLKLWNSINERL